MINNGRDYANVPPPPLAELGRAAQKMAEDAAAMERHGSRIVESIEASNASMAGTLKRVLASLANTRSNITGLAVLALSETERLARDVADAVARSASGLIEARPLPVADVKASAGDGGPPWESDDAVDLTPRGVAGHVGFSPHPFGVAAVASDGRDGPVMTADKSVMTANHAVEYDGQGDLRVEMPPGKCPFGADDAGNAEATVARPEVRQRIDAVGMVEATQAEMDECWCDGNRPDIMPQPPDTLGGMAKETVDSLMTAQAAPGPSKKKRKK